MNEVRGCFRFGVALSLGMGLFAFGACEDDRREGGTPISTSSLCCECTCTDGVSPCQHYIVEDKEATSCDVLCSDVCAATDGCEEVEEAETCAGTPPPMGFNDLLCNRVCARVYDECGLSLTDSDDLPIPTDDCDRFCQNERIPIPALDCLSQMACEQTYMLECLGLHADEQLPES